MRRPLTRPGLHPAGARIDPALASFRHLAPSSPLNGLALLALLGFGGLAARLLSPDLTEVIRSRKRHRGRYFGIEPRTPDDRR